MPGLAERRCHKLTHLPSSAKLAMSAVAENMFTAEPARGETRFSSKSSEASQPSVAPKHRSTAHSLGRRNLLCRNPCGARQGACRSPNSSSVPGHQLVAQEAQRAELGPRASNHGLVKRLSRQLAMKRLSSSMNRGWTRRASCAHSCSRRSSTHYGVHLDPEERAVAWLTRHT